MNKADLIDAIAKKTELTKKDCSAALDSLIEVIKEQIWQKKEKLTLVGFGSFFVGHRKATTVVNPKTRKKIKIPAKDVAKFKVSSTINEQLNKSKKKKK